MTSVVKTYDSKDKLPHHEIYLIIMFLRETTSSLKSFLVRYVLLLISIENPFMLFLNVNRNNHVVIVLNLQDK